MWAPDAMLPSVTPSTPAEIRDRFNADVERFSDLATGQAAQQDAPLHLELLTEAAAAVTPAPTAILDLGCGAGNYVLKLLEALGPAAAGVERIELVDLAPRMLDRAVERIGAVFDGEIHPVEADVRAFAFGEGRFDVVMAAQCLHHLRETPEWEAAFASVFGSLRPGGGFWVCDSLVAEHTGVDEAQKRRWHRYLEELRDVAYAEEVMAYVAKEDTPRPLFWQLDLLRRCGFEGIEVLHKHGRFASFGGIRAGAR